MYAAFLVCTNYRAREFGLLPNGRGLQFFLKLYVSTPTASLYMCYEILTSFQATKSLALTLSSCFVECNELFLLL